MQYWGEGEGRSCVGRRRDASTVAAAWRGGGRQARRRNTDGGGLRAAVQGLANGGVGQATELDLAANDGTEVDAMAAASVGTGDHLATGDPPDPAPWRQRGHPGRGGVPCAQRGAAQESPHYGLGGHPRAHATIWESSSRQGFAWVLDRKGLAGSTTVGGGFAFLF
jgi:hypothetical protein